MSPVRCVSFLGLIENGDILVKIIAHFEVPYYQVIDEKGELIDKLPDFAKEKIHLTKLYRTMLLNRIFDTKAIALTRTGKLGTYPSARGQEAVFSGIGDALKKDDVYVPYYRDVASLYHRGVPLKNILLYWGGDERGNFFNSISKDFPYSVPIGTQTLHATGIAKAFKIRKENNAVLVTCGDGATSQGDFYEALNVAGVWNLPVVFIVSNNQWAISVSRVKQTAAKTLAQKAIAAGFSGEQIDGNDVIVVRQRVAEALKKARENKGPTLIEMITYRHSDHTTADDATRYESKEIRDLEWKKEPIQRLYNYMLSLGMWSENEDKAFQEECIKEIEEAVQDYLNTPKETPEVMFDYLYEELPKAYSKQREYLRQNGEKIND
ncbi:pyruvate dehydrogenase (acetyl-transferring) E1 component subunit alpha [Gammaproteobacteria bacterium]|nr:pyruvate dehydrogenase (acetyl-transferring) E1 component subunit alpha [Gammaproteobacteria bacterium]